MKKQKRTMFLNRNEAEEKMNGLAKKGEAFVFMLNYQLDKGLICRPEEAAELGFFYDFNGNSNWNPVLISKAPHLTQPEFEPPTYDEYAMGFQKVMSEIKAGNTYLTNLCFKSRLTHQIDFDTTMTYSTSKYKVLLQENFISFSPETFVQIKNGNIYAHPMKGTISANMENAVELLMENSKELAEHHTIVDLLRNDLSISAKKVAVKKFRYLSKIKSGARSLFQTSSKISGRLPKNYHQQLGSILFKMLPAGSITGAPKQKTIEILNRVESFDRGFYTGIAGIYQNEILDSCVLIRFIEKGDNSYFYKSGGGITFLSNPEDEYKELIEKIYVPFT